MLSGEGVEEIFGSYPDVYMAGIHPLVASLYPDTGILSADQAFIQQWNLFYSQRSITERLRADRISTGNGINERPFITDLAIEQTVEKLVTEERIGYLRYTLPNHKVIDKFIFRLAMYAFGKLPYDYAFRPKQQSVPGSTGERQGIDAGLFTEQARNYGYSSFNDYLSFLKGQLGIDNIEILDPKERRMTRILGTDVNDYLIPADFTTTSGSNDIYRSLLPFLEK